MHYKEWMQHVTYILAYRYGKEYENIPAMPWYDWFLDGATPDMAVKWALELVKCGAK